MNQVLILTGPPGAGKTSVALALAERFDRMVHIPVDDLRHWVTAGYRYPWAGDAQAEEQLRMAADATVAVTRNAVAYRYSVIIDDVIVGANAEAYRAGLASLNAEVQVVTLLPSLARCLERDASRGAASIPDRVHALHEAFAASVSSGAQPGAVVDTTDDADARVSADRVQDIVSRGLARFG